MVKHSIRPFQRLSSRLHLRGHGLKAKKIKEEKDPRPTIMDHIYIIPRNYNIVNNILCDYLFCHRFENYNDPDMNEAGYSLDYIIHWR